MGKKDKGKKNSMLTLIEKGIDGVYETQNVLAKVWRILLIKNKITGHKWQGLITKYQNKVNKLDSRRGAANMKGNMTRRLADDRLSWGTLMRGFAIQEFDVIKVTFELTKFKGIDNHPETIEISMVINNDEIDLNNEEDEDSEYQN